MLVTKRDKSLQEFDWNKIKKVLAKTFAAVNDDFTEDDWEIIQDELCFTEGPVDVEEIQDQIQQTLFDCNYFKAATAFILYRAEHKRIRQLIDKSNYIKKYIDAENSATGSEVDANANVANKNVAVLNNELYKSDNILLSRYRVRKELKELYPDFNSKQYEEDLNNHIIYKHDESTAPATTPYCVSIMSYPFLKNGIKDLGGLSASPKNIDSYCGMLSNLIFAVSSQFAGAVAIPWALIAFDYYCRKEWGNDYYLNSDKECRIKVDGNITIKKQIEQYFQEIIYTINQPAQARGFQSCFVNFSYFDKAYFEGLYGEYCFPDGSKPQWESIEWLQEDFMNWFNNERLKTIITFPVESFSLLYKDGKWQDPKNADLVAEMYAKGHSFFTYISDSPDTLSSCCRLSNKVEDNTFNFTNGLLGEATGSKSVITLNLNRIVQDFCKENNIDSSFSPHFKKNFNLYLISILERVYKYHTAYNTILWDLYDAGMLPVYKAGFISLNQQYLTIGINGLNEAWMFLGGECNYNENYKEFCNYILSTIKEQNTKHRTVKTRFNTEFVPAESLGVKNYNWDKADGYWVPEGRNCYTSYFFLPDDKSLSILDKLKLHGKEFVSSLDGGMACHIQLAEHLTKEQYKQILEYCAKNGVNYFTFNVKNTVCDDCGYISKHTLTKCPKCGSTHILYASRPIGYLTLIKTWSKDRQIEESKRVYSNELGNIG